MLFTVTEARLRQVLEPLSKATETILEPLRIRDNEFLVIDLDKKGNSFDCQARSLRVCSLDETHEFVHNGERLCRCITPITRNAAENWAKRCPERKEVGMGHWIVAATDFTALVIHHAWKPEQLIFASEGAKVMYDFLIARFLSQSTVAETFAKYRIAKQLPELPPDYIPHPEFPLAGYQTVPLAAFLHKDASAYFMEQGTGKTAIQVARVSLESMRKRAGKIPGLKNTIYRVLVICPRQVRLNWCKEFEKFSTAPGKACVLRGGDLGRVRLLAETVRDEPDCAWATAILSQDSVETSFEALRRVPWDLLIIDESHGVKNPATSRFKAIRRLRMEGLVRQISILTGTPFANSLMDLWAQYEVMGDGMSGFSSFKSFKSFHGKFEQVDAGGTTVAKLVAIKHLPIIQERLARTAFIITKKDAGLELPDKVYDIVEVQMTSEQTRLYNLMVDALVVELEGFEDKKMTADHVLTKLLRLAQITSGFVKWDATEDGTPGRVEPIPGSNPKLEELVNLLTSEDRDPNGKTIIWACFRQDIKAICDKLTSLGIKFVSYFGDTKDKDRDAAITSFNEDPSCRVFVANPATAGSGLNLLGYDPVNPDRVDTYCDHEIFFSQGWSAVMRSQAEDRAHRKGTRTNVRITDLVVPKTIDEEIRARVTQKMKMALEISDVRDILKSVLHRSENE